MPRLFVRPESSPIGHSVYSSSSSTDLIILPLIILFAIFGMLYIESLFQLHERRRLLAEIQLAIETGLASISNLNPLSHKTKGKINNYNKVFVYEVGKLEGFIAEENTCCSICLEDYKESDECRVLYKCKHVYHKECIDLWLVRDQRCPLCRRDVHGFSIRNYN
ncbi:hypothetical protein UlMin_038488 [Ulmus minor]